MAIDSERKRKSIVAIGFPSVGPTVVPDSTIGVGDRQTIAYNYYGISSEISLASFVYIDSISLGVPSSLASIWNPVGPDISIWIPVQTAHETQI